MDTVLLKYLNLCLAKSTSCASRLFQNHELVSMQSVYQFEKDPLTPYQKEILSCDSDMSVYVTPLYQFYGCIRIDPQNILIFGPSRMKKNDSLQIRKLMIDLDIPVEKQDEFQHVLDCAPDITLDRMSWTVVLLASAFRHTSCSTQDVMIKSNALKTGETVKQSWEEESIEAVFEESLEKNSSYQMEQLISLYVENGQDAKLKKLFSSMPRATVGKMASDGIRQLKNMDICSATVFSRAAIRGGLDPKAAFRLSDLYIQQIELMRDAVALERINQELIIDYAERVRQLKCNGSDSPLVASCVTYISEHVFDRIKAADIARECGYSRCYLSTQFKQETGVSLEAYIRKEKTVEAKRLLQFTDKSLCDISIALSFSSQSHFQSTFKNVTGMTPLQYRQSIRQA